MKTLLIVIILLFALTASQAQIKGVPIDEAIPLEDVDDYMIEELYGILVKSDIVDGFVYSYLFEVKAKGYYDALKVLKNILDTNDITRGPDSDDTYLRSHVNRHDYNDVVHELRVEKDIILKIIINDFCFSRIVI